MGKNDFEYDDAELLEDGAEEELEDEDEESESDEDETESEEEDGDEADEDDAEEEEDDESDESDADSENKKVKKIVALKKQLKEAKARMSELERKKEDDDLEEQFKDKRAEMLDDGYSEKDAEIFVKLMKENALLKQKQESEEWSSLASIYPSIAKYKAQILEVKKTLPEASLEDIYLTKFSKASAYDEKIRIQQETLYKQGKAKEKGKGSASGSGSGKTKDVTKLAKSDEDAYQILLKSNPSMTRKQYKELNDMEELT